MGQTPTPKRQVAEAFANADFRGAGVDADAMRARKPSGVEPDLGVAIVQDPCHPPSPWVAASVGAQCASTPPERLCERISSSDEH